MAHLVLEGSLQLFSCGNAMESKERARSLLTSLFLDGHELDSINQV